MPERHRLGSDAIPGVVGGSLGSAVRSAGTASGGAPLSAAAAAVLVNTTKLFARTPSPGIFVNPSVPDRSGIVRRYYLQSLARKLLGRDKDFDRLNVCHRCLGFGHNRVDVMYCPLEERARLRNLAVCGSLWLCALCAGRITDGRRSELETAIKNHSDNGGWTYFSTMTIPHTSKDSLQPFQAGFQRAEKLFRDSRFFRALKASDAFLGTIRAAEVTHWLNGWHYHTHLLWFTSRELDVTREIRRPGYVAWARAVRRAGFTKLPDYRHGFYVGSTYGAVGDYVSKYGRLPKTKAWGPESEMTKGHQKRGRAVGGQQRVSHDAARPVRHRSPFELLDDWGRNQSPRDAALFVEYARAFRGQQQLRWSPGLKRELLPGETESSDAELADAALPYERVLGSLYLPDWEKVLRYDGRGEVVDIAARGNWVAVRAFVDGLGV